MQFGKRADELVKVGVLAQEAGVLPSKIRYYVREGLLEPVDQTQGGYLLFAKRAALGRLRLIDRLQREKRLTIAEIREHLATEASTSAGR